MAGEPLNFVNPIDISEFVSNLINYLKFEFLEELQDGCIKMYTSMMGQANEATEAAASQLMATPESMFPGAYAVVTSIAETVFVPIAGIILMLVLSYESISMVAENNRMKEFGPQDVYILLLKIVIGVLLLANSIDLVNVCFKIGQWAVQKTGLTATGTVLGEGLDEMAIGYIEGCTDILSMIGYLLIGCWIKVGVAIFSALVKVAVWLRFVELYMFLVSAPMPFATFLNKEFGQIGFNYIKKIFSLAFQPVYMILCFSIFAGTLVIQPGGNLVEMITKSLAAMVVLIMALFKTGTIADSIFNTH